MNRVCIFAHFDKDNLIDDYVIYYLNELRKNCSSIIFVSDSDLSESEKEKISSIVNYIQAYRHGEYDWGSYKFGYLIAKENGFLDNADELLMCNDSVYGPIYSLDKYFDKMGQKASDFWGMYQEQFGLKRGVIEPHLQSWFLCLKKTVINSDKFDEFMKSITHLDNKLEIIQKYEIGFTQEMAKYFKYDFPYTSSNSNIVTNAPLKILKAGFPFIKTSIIRKYGFKSQLKPSMNEELYLVVQKHSARFKKPNFLKLIYNNFKISKKAKKYNLTERL